MSDVVKAVGGGKGAGMFTVALSNHAAWDPQCDLICVCLCGAGA